MRSVFRTSLTTLASSLLLAIAIPACGDDDEGDNDEVGTAIDEGTNRGNTLANDAEDELGDASEADRMSMAAAIMLAIDNGEIMHSQLALDLDVTNDDEVTAFAEEMIAVHTDHIAQVEAMGAAFGFDPVDGAVTAQLVNEVEAMMRTLQTSSDPAHVYIRQQVTMHEEARIILESLNDQFDADTEFQNFVEQTRATVVDHREHAIDILRGF